MEPVSEDEQIEEWTHDRLRKRSQELQLVDDNGECIVSPLMDNRQPNDRNRHTNDEGAIVDIDDCSKSASTTSDSQITVRSSPIATKIGLPVCRHCHKNCRQKLNQARNTSLKVQHSQSSSSRCCTSSSPRSSGSRTSNHSKSQQPLTDAESSAFSPKLASRSSKGSPSSTKTLTMSNSCSNSNNNEPCKCRCTEDDFAKIERQTQEVKKETCKLLNDVSELQAAKTKSLRYWPHTNCDCSSGAVPIRESKISNMNEDTQLIGLSQFHPITNILQDDPFKAVPKISVVPPTPDGTLSTKKSGENVAPWADSVDISPEDSPQDEELPYRALNTSLKRYGTMSSLEKLPSEETDEKTYDSSETDEHDDDSNNGRSAVPRFI